MFLFYRERGAGEFGFHEKIYDTVKAGKPWVFLIGGGAGGVAAAGLMAGPVGEVFAVSEEAAEVSLVFHIRSQEAGDDSKSPDEDDGHGEEREEGRKDRVVG